MIIFTERINGMYRDIRGAIKERNKDVVQAILQEQLDGGADVIDINVGPVKGDTSEHFVWLAQTVAEVTDKPLSLDSAKKDALADALIKVREVLPDAKLIANSCTAGADYMGTVIPACVKTGAGVVGLTMDQDGVPGNV